MLSLCSLWDTWYIYIYICYYLCTWQSVIIFPEKWCRFSWERKKPGKSYRTMNCLSIQNGLYVFVLWDWCYCVYGHNYDAMGWIILFPFSEIRIWVDGWLFSKWKIRNGESICWEICLDLEHLKQIQAFLIGDFLWHYLGMLFGISVEVGDAITYNCSYRSLYNL